MIEDDANGFVKKILASLNSRQPKIKILRMRKNVIVFIFYYLRLASLRSTLHVVMNNDIKDRDGDYDQPTKS